MDFSLSLPKCSRTVRFLGVAAHLKRALARSLEVRSVGTAELSVPPAHRGSKCTPTREINENKRHSARRINRIAAHVGAHTHLEIGVSRGASFRNVRIKSKVGVDPKFRFDPAEPRNSDCDLHENLAH